MAKTVLCIDDQEAGLTIRKLLLEGHGYSVLTATSGRAGLELLANDHVDLIVLDYRMPEMNGEEVAREVRRQWPEIPILLLSGVITELSPELAELVDAHVVKGQPPAELLDTVAGLMGPGSKTPPSVSVQEMLSLSKDTARRSQEKAAQNTRRVEETKDRLSRRRPRLNSLPTER